MNGEFAYEEASAGLSWYEIGRTVVVFGVHHEIAGRARQAAATHARRNKLRWPLSEIDALDGSEAYSAFREGCSWDEIVSRYHYQNENTAKAHAALHATRVKDQETHQRIYPPVIPEKPLEPVVVEFPQPKKPVRIKVRGPRIPKPKPPPKPPKKQASVEIPSKPDLQTDTDEKRWLWYTERCSGLGWQQIADQHGVPRKTVLWGANELADKFKLPWPIWVKGAGPAPRRDRQAQAHQLGNVEKLPWDEVARRLGYSDAECARNAARLHARRSKIRLRGTKKRKYTKRDGDRQRQAYEMKLAHPELEWREISSRLEYRAKRGACTAAKQYAEANGLPFPPAEIQSSIVDVA